MDSENPLPGLGQPSSPDLLTAVSIHGQLLGQHSKSLRELVDAGRQFHIQLESLSSQLTHITSAPETLDQHSHALHELAASAKHTHTQMKDLQAQLNQLTTTMAQFTISQSPPASPSPAPAPVPDPAPPAAPADPPSSFGDPHVPDPVRYAGDQGACGDFLMQVSLVFGLQPLTYRTDEQKILYTLSLLTGAALRWGSAVWQRNGLACSSYAAFTEEMRQVFDHPLQGAAAKKGLGALTQGGQSVAEYVVEFRTLAAAVDWNDSAIRYLFQRGLNEDLKDQLASRDKVSDLNSLIELTIRLDNRLRERRREKKTLAPPPDRTHLSVQLRSYPGPRNPSPPHQSIVSARPLPSVSAHSVSVEEPMQLGRAHLTEEEKASPSPACTAVRSDISLPPSRPSWEKTRLASDRGGPGEPDHVLLPDDSPPGDHLTSVGKAPFLSPSTGGLGR
uniref:Retrotransposon gag domain-containing protein n=1 Tax=Acanthochromis polyacanthus TaxID=80966 RepID=A0A3Q1FXS7_9TELE